jgi:hypothetical protein
MSATVDTRQILQAHQLYCQLTGQNLRLDFVRERQWYDLLHQGFTVEEVRRVIVYLQREIREGRRNCPLSNKNVAAFKHWKNCESSNKRFVESTGSPVRIKSRMTPPTTKRPPQINLQTAPRNTAQRYTSRWVA